MPTTPPCTCAPEIAHAFDEVSRLSETLETVDRSIPGNAALRLTYLAMHCLERAAAICREDIPPLDGDLDDFVYVASSLIDHRGAEFDTTREMRGALRAMLTPGLGDMGFTITPENSPR